VFCFENYSSLSAFNKRLVLCVLYLVLEYAELKKISILPFNHANMLLTFQDNLRRLKMAECGCGRSPTGKCVGWHGLSEEQYQEKKAAYDAKQAAKATDN
jgi:hypothetical protein